MLVALILQLINPGASAIEISNLFAGIPQYVNGGSYTTVNDLLTNTPCATTTLGKLAHVSDLYGTVSSTLVCERDTTLGYYWRPQRTDYSAVITQSSGSVTLTPLAVAPTVYLSSTPTGSVSVVLSTKNVWPGATFHIYAPANISVNGINITGLVGSGTVPLLQGSDKVITYTTAGWKSN